METLSAGDLAARQDEHAGVERDAGACLLGMAIGKPGFAWRGSIPVRPAGRRAARCRVVLAPEGRPETQMRSASRVTAASGTAADRGAPSPAALNSARLEDGRRRGAMENWMQARAGSASPSDFTRRTTRPVARCASARRLFVGGVVRGAFDHLLQRLGRRCRGGPGRGRDSADQQEAGNFRFAAMEAPEKPLPRREQQSLFARPAARGRRKALARSVHCAERWLAHRHALLQRRRPRR